MSKVRPLKSSQGEFDNVKVAAEYFGLATSTIQGRLAKGWSVDEALGIIKRQKKTSGKVLISSAGSFNSIRDAAKRFGIKAENIASRLSLGWSVDEALGIKTRELRHPSRGKKTACAGVMYNSVAEFCDYYQAHYNQNAVRTRKRLDSGWTPEQAVGLEPKPARFRGRDGAVRDHAWLNKTVNKVGENVPDTHTGEYNLYLLTNIENGKQYVGLTTGDLKKRLRGHWNMVTRGRHSKLYNAMRASLKKLGNKSGFKLTLIRNDAKTIDELQEQEAVEISKRDALNSGYNTAQGGAIGTPKPIKVDGQLFVSRLSAAEYFGIDPALANLRLSRLKWTPEMAFELDKSRIVKQGIVVEGKKYPSIQSACKHYKLNYKTVHRRLKHSNWSIEQTFELVSPPEKNKPAHNAQSIIMDGKVYKSMSELAKFLGVSSVTVTNRIAAGWTDRQIIGLDSPPPRKKSDKGAKILVNGVKYPSLKSACEAFGLQYKIVHQRLNRSGWPIEKAFGLI